MRRAPTSPPPPIAIVGIGCRLPGGAFDPASFWRLLTEGKNAVREVPPDRWNLARYHHPDVSAPGGMVTRWGGFVDGLQGFDAGFWGVAPREAQRMDPQQRWLLEVAWEAIEDGGVPPFTLRGTRVGVFVGIAGNDYGGLQLRDAETVDAYTNSGNTASIAANRISYMLDLRGPSASVDTACSSSLVAVWMACQSLRAGACDQALAGGVNALISPQVTVGFSKAHMLSPTGQCHAFDARANGYVRAEGAGMVLLKPLARAMADGDRVYAVIRGAAVNQDGHTSSMTVPSVDGQEAMLRAAYEEAGIRPARVAYVEAHGTGTPVGDPVEATALGRVIGEGRPRGEPCLIGSVKTSIGHLEAASGIAGLIKGALVAHNRWIPASLNYERPNPEIPFEDLRLLVATRPSPLRRRDREPAVVGVNSFGFGGTNAHVVLQAPPRRRARSRPAAARAERPCALPVSARDERALRDYVERYRGLLRGTAAGLADACAAAGTRKEHHGHRLVVIGKGPREMRDRARAWLRDGQAKGVVAGRTASEESPVFVFTGQGSQWWGMGRVLLDREPTVRRRIEEIDALLRPFSGWSLIDEMQRDEATSRIDATDVAQPALFALQVALADLWRSWGVLPSAVLGHSVGEVAAAYAAGIYTLEDAALVVHHRSRLQHRTRGQGRMLAAALSEGAARALVASTGNVEIAAINDAQMVTLSGDARPLADIEGRLRRDAVFTRWVRIEYPFHSRHMDPLRDELLQALADLRPQASRVPFVSTVTGEPVSGESLDAGYWWRNLRQPVLFEAAVSGLVREGRLSFLELGPHPSLQSSLEANLAAQGRSGAVLHSLRRDADDSEELLENASVLHVRGARVDWRAVNQGSGAFVTLPSYPWNREPFWSESRSSAEARLLGPVHPLLGRRTDAAVPTWRLSLDLHRLPYLADHRIWGRVVFPAAGFGEIALAVARQVFPEEPHAVEDLEIEAPLFLSPDAPTDVQVVFDPEDKGVRIHSAGEDGATWERHARARLSPCSGPARPTAETPGSESASGTDHFHEEYRSECARRGYQFGPAFQQVRRLWRGHGEARVEIDVPGAVAEQLASYRFHPAVLDACFHAFLGLAPATAGAAGESGLYLPRAIRRIQLHAPADSRQLTAFARLVSHEGTSLVADIRVAGPDGRPVADILGFRLERVEAKSTDDLHDCYYQFRWEPRHLRGSDAAGPCGFASTAAIADAVKAATSALRVRYPLDDYHRCSALQQEVVCRLVQNAFCDLGWRPRRGDRLELARFASRLGIADEHRRVTRVLLRDLERHGWLRPAGEDAWEVLRVPRRVDAAAALDELAAARPTVGVDIAFGRRTGLRLAAVLSGEADAMELLFPDGSAEHVERFYAEGAAFPAHLEALRVALAAALARVPETRAVRVLEVGGGTGTLTRTVLPELPQNRTEYLFTDISPLFLASARHRFAELPFVEYQLFDLERDPEGQGLAGGSFDLILAGNVLHATADLRQTLAHLHRCLAPGGLLMFMELVSRDLSLGSITFGLLKGWWRASDLDLRPESPLLDRVQWMSLLAEAGFDGVDTVSCTEDPQQAEHATFLAFRPAEAVPAPTVSPAARTGRYVIFADRRGVAAALEQKLRALGHRSLLVPEGEAVLEGSIRRLLESGEELADLAGVIHCWSLDRPDAGGMTLEELRDAQAVGLMSVLRVVQAVAEGATPVFVLTRNVHRVTSCDLAEGLVSAPLLGLVRVANTELQCRFRLLDLDDCPVDRAADHVLCEVTLPEGGELETAYRGGVRHVLRFAAAPPEAFPKRTFDAARPDGAVVPYRLQADKPGILGDLALHETGRDAPGPGQIEVRVCAGGLNFRDVMKALGTYPGNPVDLRWLGDDFAGVVERVGQGVDGLRAGDRVAGIAPYAFRSHAVTDARLAFAVPGAMTFEEAATLPTAFLTADHALRHLARLQPGERVLIHAAAGGVGQAALQVARRLSLEVFATAGTPEKRELLRRMGVRHVMNSRSLAFADEILAATGGRGVDAVLNSLAGDFVPKSLSVLAPFGRFVEIGKIDVYRNARIGLQALRQNVSCFVVDLAQHFLERRDRVAEMLRELHALFAAGELRPLPLTTFPIGEAALAFRYMGQGKHVGKNVLTFGYAGLRVAFRDEPGRRFRGDATYLVTGGAGGFGLEVAKWIAREGGRHLVLMSRSGPRDAAASASIQAMSAAGVEVVDARGDVSRREDVKRVLEALRRDLPPLKGVFHAAVHMDDEFVTRQDEDRVRRVLEPKMHGAWNLHLETLAEGLEHFVCFSSFSTVIAIPKQASYNAGNAFLDQLAQYRRARDLPALSVNFGPLLGAGFVERQGKDGEALAKLGFGAFRVEEAVRLLERLLFVDATNVAAGRIDWELLVRLSPFVASSRTYRSLVGAARDEAQRGSLRARLAAAAGPDRGRLVEQFIVSQVAAVFGTAEERIEGSVPLTALGLDSLMVLELTNRVEREVGVRLPMSSLLGGPTVTELGQTLLRLLAPTLPVSAAPEVTVPPAPLAPVSLPARAGAATAARPGASPEALPGDAVRHVVLLRAGGGAPPFFAFHPAGGGVGIYAGLAPQLPADAALYGVESRLKQGFDREYPDIEQMVARYAREIREAYGGPYRLFGYSLGGYVAARVAEALERDREAVELVGVMDWDPGQKATPEAQREGLLRLAVAAYLFAQQESGIVRAVPEARLRADFAGLVDTILGEPTAGSDIFYRWVVGQKLVAAPALEPVARAQLNRFEQHCRLLTRELPLPRFRAPLCVWRARLGFGSPLEAWRHQGGHSREHVFDGDHNALVRPAGLRVVGRQLTEFLDEVRDARLEAPASGQAHA